MDNLKADIAAEVQEQVKRGIYRKDAEVTRITDLITKIRIPGPAGPRYFIIKVSEQS